MEGDLENIHDHENFACHSVEQRHLGAQQNNLECMYRCSDHPSRSLGEGGVGDGRLVEAADEVEDDCLEEVEADVTSRLYEVVATFCVNRIRFAMLVFLLVEGCRVKEAASRKLLPEEGLFAREVDLCDRSQNSRSEGHSYDHQLRPKPHQGPCRQFHQLELEA